VRGRVVDAEYRRPVPFTRISVVDATGMPVDTGASFADRDGSYSVSGLPAGEFRLTFTRSGFADVTFDVRVRAGDVEEREVRLDPVN